MESYNWKKRSVKLGCQECIRQFKISIKIRKILGND